MEKIILKANAKINLTLAVKGVREDGYHLIDTVMQSVSLHDTVKITKSDTLNLKCKIDVPMEKNIAFKAARIFFKETGISGGAEIEIIKRIPEAAGLGGGSADAAAVLAGLNRVYSAGLSSDKLCEMAVFLGADVPFFIKGGTQRCEGIGEILTEIAPLKNTCFVIAKQGVKTSTKKMYEKLDIAGYNNPDTVTVIKAIEKGDISLLAENMGNCFSDTGDYSELYEIFNKTQPLGVCLSGSGPSVFGIYKNKEDAIKADNYLKKLNINSFLAVPRGTAIEIE